MRKLIFVIFLAVSQFVSAQIVVTLDISTIVGADTTIWLTKSESKFSYSLGLVADFSNITGGSGTFYFLNSPVDTLEIVMPSGQFNINKDATKSIIGDVIPFERLGFKMSKGSLTGGIITYYFSRKQRR